MYPLCSARSMIQSASTPPPSPPMAKIAMVSGRVLVSNGAFIVASPGCRSCGDQLTTRQPLLQEPDHLVAPARLEPIPSAGIVDDRGAVERRAEHCGVRNLAAQAASHA